MKKTNRIDNALVFKEVDISNVREWKREYQLRAIDKGKKNEGGYHEKLYDKVFESLNRMYKFL